jgi:hypothetical protein
VKTNGGWVSENAKNVFWGNEGQTRIVCDTGLFYFKGVNVYKEAGWFVLHDFHTCFQWLRDV